MSADSPAAKKASSREHFDRWSGGYEDDHVSRWLQELQLEALGALEPAPDDRLLDVGCGSGAAVRAAAPTVAYAVGVDLSQGMIDRARELAGSTPNVEFLVADAEALPFEDATFTMLLCTTSFHHYPNPGSAVAEMARVLTPRGRIVISDMVSDRLIMRVFDQVLRRTQQSHVGCQRSRGLAGLLTAAGFTDPTTRTLLHGFFAIVAARKAQSATAGCH
ncbi:MAG TPA: methyltransferase domain-containing protein [Solirubrobacteraceae bacterium]|nr:methyltransferase domain-containing protein [Solirubrobacteraceae bacterium]